MYGSEVCVCLCMCASGVCVCVQGGACRSSRISNDVDWQFAALAAVQLNIEYEAIACDGFLSTFINI